MTVAELITKLQQLPPEAAVKVYEPACCDECRDSTRTPWCNFDAEPSSKNKHGTVTL